MTIIVILASMIAIIFLLQDYLKKYKQVFLPGGVYDSQAEKYQRDRGPEWAVERRSNGSNVLGIPSQPQRQAAA